MIGLFDEERRHGLHNEIETDETEHQAGPIPPGPGEPREHPERRGKGQPHDDVHHPDGAIGELTLRHVPGHLVGGIEGHLVLTTENHALRQDDQRPQFGGDGHRAGQSRLVR